MNLFETIPEAKTEYKERLFATADFVVVLSTKARREGILALEEHLGGWSEDYGTEPPPLTMQKNESNDYDNEAAFTCPFAPGGIEEAVFRRLLMLVVDGMEQEKIADVARYTIAASHEDDVTTLSLMIGIEGILSIQRGDNPRIITILLASMMGRTLGDEYCKTRLKD